MDDEKYRRFEHVIGLYIYYISRKLDWARKQLDRPEATSRVLNEAIDEIAVRLAELEIAVVSARDARSTKSSMAAFPAARNRPETET